MDRYRYRLLQDEEYTLLLRDDGYRIWFLMLHPPQPDAPLDWELWADYKQCNLARPASRIATCLMGGEEL